MKTGAAALEKVGSLDFGLRSLFYREAVPTQSPRLPRFGGHPEEG
jgi:hypothetical protein